MKTSFLNALAAPLLHTSERDEIEPNKIQPNSNSARRLFGILGITAASCVLVASAVRLQFATDVTMTSVAFTAEQYSLKLRVDGVTHEYTVVALNSTPASVFSVAGGTLSLGHGHSPPSVGTRLWIAHDASHDPYSYAKFSLLGKRLSYQVDLSRVPCSCNAALYWVSMPGYAQDDTPTPGAFGNYCALLPAAVARNKLSCSSLLALPASTLGILRL